MCPDKPQSRDTWIQECDVHSKYTVNPESERLAANTGFSASIATTFIEFILRCSAQLPATPHGRYPSQSPCLQTQDVLATGCLAMFSYPADNLL